MTQETLNQLIEAGRPVPITTGLINAAHERAHRQRSEALRAGFRWTRRHAKAAIFMCLPNHRHQASPT